MTIAIITAIWQREKLTRIFLKSVQRYWKQYGIFTMIAGSEGVKTRELCLDHGAGYVEVPNQPLGNKFNQALIAARANYNPDGFIIMGSDDFMDDRVISEYYLLLSKGIDVAGFKDCYFYDAKTKEAAYWGGYTVKHRQNETIGMGRLLSKKVYERLRGRFWNPGAKAGLDWLMQQKLRKITDFKKQLLTVKDGYVLVDVKGFGNFNSIAQYQTEPVNTEIFDIIPEFSEIKEL